MRSQRSTRVRGSGSTSPLPVSARQLEIAQVLRRRIRNGTYAPGRQMPSRDALTRQFHTSKLTVQGALNQLVRDGFVRVHAKRGSYVADHLPQLTRYALVLPGFPTGGSAWSRFWESLSVAAAAPLGEGRRVEIYYGVDGRRDAEDHLRLVQAIEHERLAGLILGSPLKDLAGTLVVTRPGLPRVVLSWASDVAGWPALYPDVFGSFPRKAIDDLASRGRQRVAIITAAHGPIAGVIGQWFPRMRQRGMTPRPEWVQSVHFHNAHWARQVAMLLMSGRRVDRPDALVITDDNLVEPATHGLRAAGVRVPRDLDVIAMSTLPCRPRSAVPVRWLGFDAAKILAVGRDLIDALRRDQAVPRVTLVPAAFDAERL